MVEETGANLHKANRIQAFIISWSGTHANALNIYDCISAYCDKTFIVYSDRDDEFAFEETIFSIRRPNELMFGDKFRTCIEAFSGDIFLLIHADCHCDDWVHLLKTCGSDFLLYPEIGVWSPQIENSWPTLKMAEIFPLENSDLSIVANTDAIVFGLCSQAVERLRECDYEQNIHGWWAHVPAVIASHAQKRFAVVNRKITVRHAPGRGYVSGVAHAEGRQFLRNMSVREQALWVTIEHYCESRQPKRSFIRKWVGFGRNRIRKCLALFHS